MNALPDVLRVAVALYVLAVLAAYAGKLKRGEAGLLDERGRLKPVWAAAGLILALAFVGAVVSLVA